MTVLTFISRTAMVSCISAAVAMNAALAQPAQKPYEPTVGQDGKDVIWVPTPQALVDKMLDMAKVTAADKVVDLGSGDGRTVITAAKRGATARGIEFNPKMVELSKRNATAAGVGDKATFVEGDMYVADISKASVMALFLLPSNMLQLRQKFLDLRPGSRIVSNTFGIEGWNPDETVTIENGCSAWCTALLWIVPAKVGGKWRLGDGDLIRAVGEREGRVLVRSFSQAAAGRVVEVVVVQDRSGATGRRRLGRRLGGRVDGVAGERLGGRVGERHSVGWQHELAVDRRENRPNLAAEGVQEQNHAHA